MLSVLQCGFSSCCQGFPFSLKLLTTYSKFPFFAPGGGKKLLMNEKRISVLFQTLFSVVFIVVSFKREKTADVPGCLWPHLSQLVSAASLGRKSSHLFPHPRCSLGNWSSGVMVSAEEPVVLLSSPLPSSFHSQATFCEWSALQQLTHVPCIRNWVGLG